MTASSAAKPAVFEGRYTYTQIKAGSKTGESLMAFDEETLEFVVIKRPSLTHPNPHLREAAIADLQREERALSLPGIRDHPAVCRLLATGQAAGPDGPYRYLVLERARGTRLPELLRRYHVQGQSVPERVCLGILRQLLDLLVVAHRAGVIYNDVKADHLFWDETAGQLKVIDWGNAQSVGDSGAVTPTADVFQSGELLYELLAGVPYTPASAQEWEVAGRPAWQLQFYHPVAPGVRQMVEAALHPDPAQRYSSIAEFARDVETCSLRREPPAPAHVTMAPVEMLDQLQDVEQVVAGGGNGKSGQTLRDSPEDTPVAPGESAQKAAAAPTSRRARRRNSFLARIPRAHPAWTASAVAVVAIAVGLAIGGVFTAAPPETGRQTSGASVSASALPATPEPASTAGPAPPPMAVDICAKLTEAEQAHSWQEVIALLSGPAVETAGRVPACGDRSLARIEAQARFRLGLEAYSAGNYSASVQQWTAAQNLDPLSETPILLLTQCATARAQGDIASFVDLIGQFGVAAVEVGCGFDPGAYLPTQAARITEIDLLSAMTGKRFSLTAPACRDFPCPGLYQDDARQWHLSTFYDYAKFDLPLDEDFQTNITGRAWDENLREVGLEFSIHSVAPNSFPYSTQVGLGARAQTGEAVLLVITSRPFLEASVSAILPYSGLPACETVSRASYVIVDDTGSAQPHSMSFRWEAAQAQLQLFVDDHAVCKYPLPFPSAPQASLYLAGWGVDLEIARLAATLNQP